MCSTLSGLFSPLKACPPYWAIPSATCVQLSLVISGVADSSAAAKASSEPAGAFAYQDAWGAVREGKALPSEASASCVSDPVRLATARNASSTTGQLVEIPKPDPAESVAGPFDPTGSGTRPTAKSAWALTFRISQGPVGTMAALPARNWSTATSVFPEISGATPRSCTRPVYQLNASIIAGESRVSWRFSVTAVAPL